MSKNGNRFFFLSSVRIMGFPIKHTLAHKQINVSESQWMEPITSHFCAFHLFGCLSVINERGRDRMGKKEMSISGSVSSSISWGGCIKWPPKPHLLSSVTFKLFLQGVGISQHSDIICDILSLYPYTRLTGECLYDCEQVKNLWKSEIWRVRVGEVNEWNFYGCHNTLLQSQWLKTTQMY